MGQVNVNPPPGEPAPREGGYGAGLIVGILVAIIIIVLLVYFLVLQGDGTTTPPADGDQAPPGDGDTDGETQESPSANGWRLADLA